MKNFDLKFKNFLFFSYLVVIFCFVFFVFYSVLEGVQATSDVNFQIEIFYSKEVHQIDTTQSFEETLLNPNNSSLEISLSADVLSSGEEVELTVYSTPEDAVTVDKPLPSEKLGANIFYNISFKKVSDDSTVSSFDKATTLTFYYTDSDISGIDESTLAVYHWNGSDWVALSDSVVDVSLNKVTATTQQFSYFGILGDAPSGDDGDGGDGDGGGGGGGGGGAVYIPPVEKETKVILQGKAYPGASITVLEDGKVATTKKADSGADFKITITDLTAGTYTFGLWAEDKDGRRSITFSFTTTIRKDMTTTIGGIFIPPTIELEKVRVSRGEIVNIFGQTAPESEITISVESPQITKKAEANEEGAWDYPFDTSPLTEGSHITRAKAETPEGLLSSYSKVLSFYVGKFDVEEIRPKADFNKDDKTNLIDFSIMLYWWGKYNPAVDQNQNGIVDLPDFSILMYWWTG